MTEIERIPQIEVDGFSSAAQREAMIHLEEDLRIVKLLHKSKFPLLLVYSHEQKQHLVAKIFPYKNGKINPHFLRELPISSLAHPNIITFHEAHSQKRGLLHKQNLEYSYILMEFAPYQDFIRAVNDAKIYEDEKLARTYFHHLIEGLEYLHNRGYAHMDLKPDNLLMAEDCKLKIADFDCCYFRRDTMELHRGTRDYRAPEVIAEKCVDPFAADIYSVGVILFLFFSGISPYNEDTVIGDDIDLHQTLLYQPSKYFKQLKKCHHYDIKFDSEFKKLFLSMVNSEPTKRPSISQIKASKWYQKETYSAQELRARMVKRVSPVNIEY
jgi:serine/threonine protein kinase